MSVWIQYYPGDCGTWFSWFVNQHQGFLGNSIPLKINDPVCNEVIYDGAMWEFGIHDWKQFREQTGSEHSRTAIKTYPQHNLHDADWHRDEYESEDAWFDSDWGLQWEDYQRGITKHMPSVPDLQTVLLTTQQEHRPRFVSRMSATFATFVDGTTAESSYRHRDWDYARTVELTQQYLPNTPYMQFDISTLLFGRNWIEREQQYRELCNFLNTEPNPHWKTLVDFYVHQVFENY